MVLRARREAFKNLGCGRALIGLKARALTHVHQGVWLLAATGDNAARAVVFKRATHHAMISSHKGRGEGVTLEALHRRAVKGEVDGGAAI